MSKALLYRNNRLYTLDIHQCEFLFYMAVLLYHNTVCFWVLSYVNRSREKNLMPKS